MLFIVDFDGTVAPTDTVDSLLEEFADPEWRRIEKDWISGLLNSRECMKAQIALVQSDRITLEKFFRSIEIDPNFSLFVSYVSDFAEVVLVSDGLDYPINMALRNIGLSTISIYANHLEFLDGRLDLSFPFANSGCTQQSGVCKCSVMHAVSARAGEPSILIGDGRSDFCIAGSVDYVFAKGLLREYCEIEGISHSPIESFYDVIAEVRKWDSTQFIDRNEEGYVNK